MPSALQVIAVSMPSGSGPAGRLLEEVDRLHSRGGVRVLDMLLVSKDEEGTLMQSSFGGDDDFGALVSRLFPTGDPASTPPDDAPADLWARARSLPPGTATAFLLVEHAWARGIFDLIDAEGGSLLGAGFLTPELGVMIDAEVTAMEEAARSIFVAQAAEADSRLRIAAARGRADEAVAESELIRSAAAAEAVRVLADAGLMERAALQEAVDALTAAGLVAAAADAAAEGAIEADAATVAAADQQAVEAIAADTVDVADADARRAEVARAASVTPAELRVLRYLPTKLTFALIADKLGISREAAKSRAERAYKKLGVHSRGDAVRRARELRVAP